MLSISAVIIRYFTTFLDGFDCSDPDLAIASEVSAVRIAAVVDELGVATGFSVNAIVLIKLEDVERALLGFVSSETFGSIDLFAGVFD